MRHAAAWLVAREIRVRGDCAVYRPHLEPSGWAFEFENVHYPDIDDPAIIAADLAATTMEDKIGEQALQGAIGQAVKWQAGTQSSKGAGPPSTGTVNPGSYRKFPAQNSGNPWTRQASMRPPRCWKCMAGWVIQRTIELFAGACPAYGNNRSMTGPGSDAGASTLSTARQPCCRRWNRWARI